MKEVLLQAGASAFGTGQHTTTVLALEAMFALAEEGRAFARILDMGCGSGVLSLIAAGLWPQAEILAVDSEASAVEATQANVVENGLADRIRTMRSEGFARRAAEEGGPYDLVICNIFAEPIIAMAAPMARVASGMVVLSGILPWLESQVNEVYGGAGFTHLLTLARENWRCLMMERSAAR